jgi:hypothetical protein
MRRRRGRSLEAEWYDLFADWALADQEAALRTLTELHRQAVRQAQRDTVKPNGSTTDTVAEVTNG